MNHRPIGNQREHVIQPTVNQNLSTKFFTPFEHPTSLIYLTGRTG